MATLSIILPTPDRNDKGAWDPACWEADLADLITALLATEPERAILPWIPGRTMAVAKALAEAGIPVTLVAPYRGRTVSKQGQKPTYRTWESYWDERVQAYSAALRAMPGVGLAIPEKRAEAEYAEVDRFKREAYQKIGEAANLLITTREAMLTNEGAALAAGFTALRDGTVMTPSALIANRKEYLASC